MKAFVAILWMLPFMALAEPIHCPEGIGAAQGDDPKLTQKTSAKWTVFVCGAKENRFGRDIFSEFELYATQGRKPVKLSFQATAVDQFSIRGTSQGLILSELALLDNEWLPLFNRAVVCGKAGCRVTRKTCANEKLRHKTKSARSLLDYYKKDAKKGASTGQATDEAEIAIVLAAALGGEKDAIEAFDKNPGFRLDGASAAEYDYGKRTLQQLKAMHCRF